MKILVTGSGGFVGKHLVDELRKRGHEVWGCDRHHDVGERYVRCDTAYYRQVEHVLDEKSFEYVYHLAAEFGRWSGEEYYENLWMSNVVGTKNVLRVQESLGFRLVFFSSSEVYGDWGGTMSESVMDEHEIKQLNDYALTKWVGELQVVNSAAAFGTESVRVRPFNLYGPGERPSPYRSALSRFIYHALFDEPYTVFGSHRRRWLYIDDAVEALANITEDFEPGEAYNIGSTEDVTTRELSDLVLQVCGRTDNLVTYEQEEGMTTHTKDADVSKAQGALGLRTTVSLAEGIELTAKWMQEAFG